MVFDASTWLLGASNPPSTFVVTLESRQSCLFFHVGCHMRAQVAYRLRRIADKIAPAPTLVARTPTIGELDDVWRYMERDWDRNRHAYDR